MNIKILILKSLDFFNSSKSVEGVPYFWEVITLMAFDSNKIGKLRDCSGRVYRMLMFTKMGFS